MLNFLKPPPHQDRLPADQQDAFYKRMRWQVFMGIFVGYAGYYLVRKNFSLAIPDLIRQGYDINELGFALSGVSITYGISKFLMGNLSDRSNARIFLSLGLFLSALTMIFMGVAPWATSSISIMFILMMVNGWFQGMGWPPCGRVMVHWFSVKERGLGMSIWNTAHNVGGGLMALIVALAVYWFGGWESKLIFPGVVAIFVAAITYFLVRDTPQSCGLPPIEEYKNEPALVSTQDNEKELSAKAIFMEYVLPNKVLWYIALANVFVYMVRYGVLDWAPTYLSEVKGYNVAESSWAYFAFEYAGIPGTLLCGWISDKVFKGRRAPAAVIYMVLVTVAVLVYWMNPRGHVWIDNISLAAIGFLIYGPVMLIGVFALDLVPKKAAGTAAGFTGLFGYLGDAVFAKIILSNVVKEYGWDGGFVLLLIACVIAILLTLLTWRHERMKR